MCNLPSFKINGLDSSYELFDPTGPEIYTGPTSFIVCVPPQVYYYHLVTTPTPQWVRAEQDGNALVWKGLLFGHERVNILHVNPVNLSLPPDEEIFQKILYAKNHLPKLESSRVSDEFAFKGSDKLNNQLYILRSIASMAVSRPDIPDDYLKSLADWEQEWQNGLIVAITTNPRKLEESFPAGMHSDIKGATKEISRYLNHENINKLRFRGVPDNWPTIGEVFDYFIGFAQHLILDKTKLDLGKVLRIAPEIYNVTVGKLHSQEQLVFLGLNELQEKIVSCLCNDFVIAILQLNRPYLDEVVDKANRAREKLFKEYSIRELEKFIHLLSDNSVTSESDDIILDYFFALSSAAYTGTGEFDELFRWYKKNAVLNLGYTIKCIRINIELIEKGYSTFPENQEISILRSMTLQQIKTAIEKESLSAKRLLLLLMTLPKDHQDDFLTQVLINEVITRGLIDEIMASTTKTDLDALELPTIKAAVDTILMGDGARTFVGSVRDDFRPVFYSSFPKSFLFIDHQMFIHTICSIHVYYAARQKYALELAPHYAHLMTSGLKLYTLAQKMGNLGAVIFLKSEVAKNNFDQKILLSALRLSEKVGCEYDCEVALNALDQFCSDLLDLKKSWLVTSGDDFRSFDDIVQVLDKLPTYLWYKLWELPGFEERVLTCLQDINKASDTMDLSKEKILTLIKKLPHSTPRLPSTLDAEIGRELQLLNLPIDLDEKSHHLLLVLTDDLNVYISNPCLSTENRNVLNKCSVHELEGIKSLMELSETDNRWKHIFYDLYSTRTHFVDLPEGYSLDTFESIVREYLPVCISQIKQSLQLKSWVGTNKEIACLRSQNYDELKSLCLDGTINTAKLWSAVLSAIPVVDWERFLTEVNVNVNFGFVIAQPLIRLIRDELINSLDIFDSIDPDHWDALIHLPRVAEFIVMFLYHCDLLSDLSSFSLRNRVHFLEIPEVRQAIINKMDNNNFISYLKLFPRDELLFNQSIRDSCDRILYAKENICLILQNIDHQFLRFLNIHEIHSHVKSMIENGQLEALLQSIKPDRRLEFLLRFRVALAMRGYDEFLLSLKSLPLKHRYQYVTSDAIDIRGLYMKSGVKTFSILQLLTFEERDHIYSHGYIRNTLHPTTKSVESFSRSQPYQSVIRYIASVLLIELTQNSIPWFVGDGDDLFEASQFEYIINNAPESALKKFWAMPKMLEKLEQLIRFEDTYLPFLQSLNLDKRWPFILSSERSLYLYKQHIVYHDAKTLFSILGPVPHDISRRLDILIATQKAYEIKDSRPKQSSAQYPGLNTYQQPPEDDRSFLKELEGLLRADYQNDSSNEYSYLI